VNLMLKRFLASSPQTGEQNKNSSKLNQSYPNNTAAVANCTKYRAPAKLQWCNPWGGFIFAESKKTNNIPQDLNNSKGQNYDFLNHHSKKLNWVYQKKKMLREYRKIRNP